MTTRFSRSTCIILFLIKEKTQKKLNRKLLDINDSIDLFKYKILRFSIYQLKFNSFNSALLSVGSNSRTCAQNNIFSRLTLSLSPPSPGFRHNNFFKSNLPSEISMWRGKMSYSGGAEVDFLIFSIFSHVHVALVPGTEIYAQDMVVRVVRTNRIQPKLKFTIQITLVGAAGDDDDRRSFCIRQRVDEERY